MNFFICKHCGNIIEKIVDKGVKVVCCGEPMTELVANSTVAATEKHLPAVHVTGNTVSVQVGDIAHPMLDAHYIQWIVLESKNGVQRVDLKPGMEPVATFALTEGDTAVAVYEFCNLHGLWETKL